MSESRRHLSNTTPSRFLGQKFVNLFVMTAGPAIFWIGIAGLIGVFKFGQTPVQTYFFMSPGVALLLLCAAVSLFLNRYLHRGRWLVTSMAIVLLVTAYLSDHYFEGWYGERDALLNTAIGMGVCAALLVLFVKTNTREAISPRYSIGNLALTIGGAFISVFGAYLMIERDLAQGQHYAQTSATSVGHALRLSFDQPIDSVQRMTERLRVFDGWPDQAFVAQEFSSHLRDMPSMIGLGVIDQDGAIRSDIRSDAQTTRWADALATLLKKERAVRTFLDAVHRSGQSSLSVPGLVPGFPELALIAAPIGAPQDPWRGAVVAVVDLTVLVRDAFRYQTPPCCFIVSSGKVEFYRSTDIQGLPAVAMADASFAFPRMFPWEITFWKEKLPGEVGMSTYPIWTMVIGLLFTFFAGLSQRLAQLAFYRARLLQQRSLQDPLTGLPNRRKLRRVLQDAFRQKAALSVHDEQSDHQARSVGRSGSAVRPCLMFIDMGGLRLINDSLGHEFGDKLIVMLAARLKRMLTELFTDDALLARVDGGEFVILFPRVDQTTLGDLVQSVLRSVSSPIEIQGQELSVSATIGVSSAKGQVSDPMQLVREADLALLDAKHHGTQGWAQYDEDMGRRAELNLILSQQLTNSLASGELMMVYQPLIDARDGRIVGMESLIRWHHPERGFLSPAQFIPIAEASGQIVELTNWTLKRVCRDAALIHAEDDQTLIPIAVNISPVYFQRDDFIEQIREVLETTGVKPQQLQLEITEGVFLTDHRDATVKLDSLRAMGVLTSLDDFGTGYSSLGYLIKLPVHKVKLDRSFVVDVTTGESDAALVQGVIDIVHRLGMLVVIEGVETEAQATLLRSFGSDQFQGYFFSKPLPLEEVTSLVRSNPVFLTPIDS